MAKINVFGEKNGKYEIRYCSTGGRVMYVNHLTRKEFKKLTKDHEYQSMGKYIALIDI